MIIQFLLDNLFFLGIAAALIFSFLGKLKQAAGPAQSKQGNIETRQADGQSIDAVQRGHSDLAGHTAAPSSEVYRSKPRQDIDRNIGAVSSHRSPRIPVRLQTLKKVNGSVPEEYTHLGLDRIRKKEIVQGMIFAEIMGKPRALNPYQSPRNRN